MGFELDLGGGCWAGSENLHLVYLAQGHDNPYYLLILYYLIILALNEMRYLGEGMQTARATPLTRWATRAAISPKPAR